MKTLISMIEHNYIVKLFTLKFYQKSKYKVTFNKIIKLLKEEYKKIELFFAKNTTLNKVQNFIKNFLKTITIILLCSTERRVNIVYTNFKSSEFNNEC